jgi:hypothetical protein
MLHPDRKEKFFMMQQEAARGSYIWYNLHIMEIVNSIWSRYHSFSQMCNISDLTTTTGLNVFVNAHSGRCPSNQGVP